MFRTASMMIAPFLLLFVTWGLLELNRNYFQVEPVILQAYHKKDLEALVGMIQDPEFNPWQQRNAIMYAARLHCVREASFVQNALKDPKIESRTGLFEGCFSLDWEEASWIVPYSLQDPTLSYNRLLGMEYLEKEGKVRDFSAWILAAAESDGSMMVKNAAQSLVRRHELKPSSQK